MCVLFLEDVGCLLISSQCLLVIETLTICVISNKSQWFVKYSLKSVAQPVINFYRLCEERSHDNSDIYRLYFSQVQLKQRI